MNRRLFLAGGLTALMATPRTIGQGKDRPTGASQDSDTGLEGSGYARRDHKHPLWTPWVDAFDEGLVSGLQFGGTPFIQLSICPPLVSWSLFFTMDNPFSNPIATNNPYTPVQHQVIVTPADSVPNLVFKSDGDIDLVDLDLTTKPGGGPIFEYYHFTYRYDG